MPTVLRNPPLGVAMMDPPVSLFPSKIGFAGADHRFGPAMRSSQTHVLPTTAGEQY